MEKCMDKNIHDKYSARVYVVVLATSTSTLPDKMGL